MNFQVAGAERWYGTENLSIDAKLSIIYCNKPFRFNPRILAI
jgi:hypothetical protein